MTSAAASDSAGTSQYPTIPTLGLTALTANQMRMRFGRRAAPLYFAPTRKQSRLGEAVIPAADDPIDTGRWRQ